MQCRTKSHSGLYQKPVTEDFTVKSCLETTFFRLLYSTETQQSVEAYEVCCWQQQNILEPEEGVKTPQQNFHHQKRCGYSENNISKENIYCFQR